MVNVRPFETNDAPRASEILIAAFKGFLGDRFNTLDAAHFSSPELIKSAHVQDAFGESRIFVAEEEDNLVGVVKVSATLCGLGCFDYVGVDPACHARGVGALLMASAEEFWTERKQRKIHTCVAAHNKKAILYYVKHNFVPEGYCRDHFRDGVDEIMLGRVLKAESAVH